ncbi:hypothetical protein EJ02DRAFT_344731 [Clathrospora elynae]|uniref:Uncharacterized protein n=1 Tax=Clathrospora elynae TaxID=706981 RepID=A0A6A5SSS2_9PLEO|nr:hypothetical protein EJ02DRAFT_344731 [Clathrospora elynae]
MAVPRVKSRVQFQGRTKQGARPGNNKNHVERARPKHTNSVAHSPKNITKTYTFSIEDDDPIYEEFDDSVEIENPVFERERVFSAVEKQLSGAFNSELRATVRASNVSAVMNSSDDCACVTDDESDPSDSLLGLAPLYVPYSDEHAMALQSQPSPTAGEEHIISSTWVQKLVTLFGGRRKTPSVQTNKNRRDAGPTPRQSPKHSPKHSPKPSSNCHEPVFQSSKDSARTAPEQSIPPPRRQLPRLTLPQVIPPIRVTTSEHLSHRLGYFEIRPAPHHQYTGYGFVSQDIFEPAAILRGFVVPRSPQPVPLAQRRNNSASNLIDRDGDAWAVWSERNPGPGDMPFARTRSDSDLLHPRSALRSGRPAGRYEQGGQTRLQAGHCVIEDAEDKYPFNQGLCW